MKSILEEVLFPGEDIALQQYAEAQARADELKAKYQRLSNSLLKYSERSPFTDLNTARLEFIAAELDAAQAYLAYCKFDGENSNTLQKAIKRYDTACAEAAKETANILDPPPTKKIVPDFGSIQNAMSDVQQEMERLFSSFEGYRIFWKLTPSCREFFTEFPVQVMKLSSFR